VNIVRFPVSLRLCPVKEENHVRSELKVQDAGKVGFTYKILPAPIPALFSSSLGRASVFTRLGKRHRLMDVPNTL
jgi:hypothetical protein